MLVAGIIRRAIKIPAGVRRVALIIGVIVLGLILAFLLYSSFQQLVISIFWMLFFLGAIALNPLNGLLIWLANHPFTEITVNIEMGRGIPDLSLARACVAFLLVLVLVQTAIGKRKMFSLTRVELSFLLFIIAYGVSMVNILQPSRIFQYLFDIWALPLIVYFLIKNLVTDWQTLHKTLKIFLYISVYSAIYMLYELLTGNILFLKEAADFQFYSGTNLRIVRGLYGSTLVFGLIFNWLLPIATYYFLNASTLSKKVVYGLIIGLLLVGDIFTYKRTTWLAMLVSFLFVQWFYPQFRRFFIILVLLFAMVLAFTWDSVSQSELYANRVANQAELDTANGRADRWAVGWELWLQKPLFGHGFRQFNTLSKIQHVENDYLEIMVSAGLAAIVPYIAFFVFILIDSIKIYRQIGVNKKLFVDRQLIVVFWGLYSTYFITAMSSSGNDGNNMANLVFFGLIAAIVGSQAPLVVRQQATQINSTQ